MLRAARTLLIALAWLLAAGPAPAQTVILYAHADAARQVPIAALAAVWGPVVDYRTQRPGTLWRAHLAGEIRRARTVLVLWSTAAAASIELQTELRMAYANHRARLVPVLLDDTPMPPELGTRHAINPFALVNPLEPPCPANH